MVAGPRLSSCCRTSAVRISGLGFRAGLGLIVVVVVVAVVVVVVEEEVQDSASWGLGFRRLGFTALGFCGLEFVLMVSGFKVLSRVGNLEFFSEVL